MPLIILPSPFDDISYYSDAFCWRELHFHFDTRSRRMSIFIMPRALSSRIHWYVIRKSYQVFRAARRLLAAAAHGSSRLWASILLQQRTRHIGFPAFSSDFLGANNTPALFRWRRIYFLAFAAHKLSASRHCFTIIYMLDILLEYWFISALAVREWRFYFLYVRCYLIVFLFS